MKNKYLISFLVPMYKEGEEIIKPLLDSIALQQNIDFNKIEVVITHDGIIPDIATYKLSKEFLNTYPFDIKYLEKEHAGVSAARNYCFDHCNGKYVCFCDADDMFFNACGLWIIFREINNGGFDSLTSVFIEETRDPITNTVAYINHDQDSTFVHGKFHKRDFLIKNNIRWNDNLTIHEDSFFNYLCRSIASKTSKGMKYCQTPFYLWKWRGTSVCRHDPLYLNRTMRNMIQSNTALIKEFLNRGMKEDAKLAVYSMMTDLYYSLCCDRWWDTEEGHSYLLPTELECKKYWNKFKNLYNKVNKEEALQITAGIRQRFFVEGLLHEKITFEDWIKHIETLKNSKDGARHE